MDLNIMEFNTRMKSNSYPPRVVNPPNNYIIPFYIGTTPYHDLVKANMYLNMDSLLV